MKKYDGRLRLFSIFIIFIALALSVRLYFLQIVSGSIYRDKAEHQYVAGANYFDRGTIYFSTKDGALVPAADLATGYILTVNPSMIQSASSTEMVYEKLAAVVPVDRASFLMKAGKAGDTYEEIASHLTQEQTDAINADKLAGVTLYKERWRDYPGQSLAAQTIGFIGYQGDTVAGRYGLERYYETTLVRNGKDSFTNFFAQIFSNIKNIASTDGIEQGDIVTTIEPSVQSFLETELSKVNQQYSSEFSGGIVIDPTTGEIVAMAEEPSFDPNNRAVSDLSLYRNKLVEDRYEMGSIIKALTMASGIDSGAVTAKTTYNDPGCMTLSNKTFCNYDQQSHGSNLPMQVVLDESLNTGAAFVALKMGPQAFSDYMLHRLAERGQITGF